MNHHLRTLLPHAANTHLHEQLLLLMGPRLLIDARAQVVVPPLPTLHMQVAKLSLLSPGMIWWIQRDVLSFVTLPGCK